jgi:hypothetical protein
VVIREVPEAFDYAKAVFLGDVTEIIEPKSADEKAPLSVRLFVIKFKVVKAWKGIGFASQEISVLANQGRSGCFDSPTLQKGLRYLVFADPLGEGEGLSVIGVANRTTAVRPGLVLPKSVDPSAIDPFFDMKQLDALLIRPRTFDDGAFRRQGDAPRFRLFNSGPIVLSLPFAIRPAYPDSKSMGQDITISTGTGPQPLVARQNQEFSDRDH